VISADTAPSRRRLVALIVPGDGPHLVAPYRSPAKSMRPRVSVADELGLCLTMLDQDPERFERAAASWHARCSDLADLTLVDATQRSPRSSHSPGLSVPTPRAFSGISPCVTGSAPYLRSSNAGSRGVHTRPCRLR